MSGQTNIQLTGTIYDQKGKERIIGATIHSPNNLNIVTVSDENGNYSLSLNEGDYMILCSFVGMESDTAYISVKALQNTKHDFYLQGKEKMLETVVISASKFEQKLSELTVSMEVIRPSLIESRNTTNITEVLDQIPGLTILDGEPQIRSGSGFSFGV